jgi:hypothetical protein
MPLARQQSEAESSIASKQALQKSQLSELMRLLEEEKNSHEGRQPLQLSSRERDIVSQHLSDSNTKHMIRRTDQLLPVFVLLGGGTNPTRELIRKVISMFPYPPS